MNYIYGVYFTAKPGKKEFKFGSGTDGRRAYIERTLADQGFTDIYGEQMDTGNFGHRALEAAVHARHAATRSWEYRGMFDGSTEVWPASEGPVMMRTAAKILAAMKSGAKFDEPEASEAVIDLIHNTITNMPNHEQLNVLDLCSGDGVLSNNLVGEVARIQQVTIDPPATLPGDTPNFDIQVVPGDVLTIPDDRHADVVVMNPPFSDRKEAGNHRQMFGYWPFIRKAQALAPVVIFIAPDGWESGLRRRDERGIYEVIEYAADFGNHPQASVIRWTAGPEFAVIGGRADRRIEAPAFDVSIQTVINTKEQRYAASHGITKGSRILKPGDTCSWNDIVFLGPDAAAAAAWCRENWTKIGDWWGRDASGRVTLSCTAIKELLT